MLKRIEVAFYLCWIIFYIVGATADMTCESARPAEETAVSELLNIAGGIIERAKKYEKVKDNIKTSYLLGNPIDCEGVLSMNKSAKSGVYQIWPRSRVSEGSINVLCDMDDSGGGWTIIQRRGDFDSGKEYFFQDWAVYKAGFGDLLKDFWLGNDNIYALTNQRACSIKFQLFDWTNNYTYATYDEFWIDDEDHKYTVHVSGFRGNAAKPLNVRIISSPHHLSAGKEVTLECESRGSRPGALMSWYKRNRKVQVGYEISDNANLTRSRYTFVPMADDDGKKFMCAAENPPLLNSRIIDAKVFSVHYIPEPRLALGENIQYSSLKEGGDVYFNCKIIANPGVYNVSWRFQNTTLLSSIYRGIIINNQTLILQRLKKEQRGMYQCVATNSEGEGRSQEFQLDFQLTSADEVSSDLCMLPNGNFPNPNDCQSYIRCRNGIPELQKCNKGLLFNPFLWTCDYNKTGNCSSVEDFYTSPSFEPSDIVCPADGPNIFANASSCYKYYYLCDDGVAFRVQCPDGLLMNQDIRTCDYAKETECAKPIPDRDVLSPSTPNAKVEIFGYLQDKIRRNAITAGVIGGIVCFIAQLCCLFVLSKYVRKRNEKLKQFAATESDGAQKTKLNLPVS